MKSLPMFVNDDHEQALINLLKISMNLSKLQHLEIHACAHQTAQSTIENVQGSFTFIISQRMPMYSRLNILTYQHPKRNFLGDLEEELLKHIKKYILQQRSTTQKQSGRTIVFS